MLGFYLARKLNGKYNCFWNQLMLMLIIFLRSNVWKNRSSENKQEIQKEVKISESLKVGANLSDSKNGSTFHLACGVDENPT